jgi:aldose 1-epimerase
MAYTITTRQAEGVQGLDPTIYVLEDGAGGLVEVWPAIGFNCIRWRAVRDSETLELVHSDADLFCGGKPTRSGIPVLFPFPNRIREGRYSFEGKTYQLPLNDSTQKNAIHGFACRVPWRVLDHGADTEGAWVTAEFRCSLDAPASLAYWPVDQQMRLTIRLGRNSLKLDAVIHNPETKPMPWGLGYHPYIRLPFSRSSEMSAAACTIEVPAREYWELKENLPTGERRAVDDKRDLNTPRKFPDLNLDDVLTSLPSRAPRMDGLIERSRIHGAAGSPLRLFCSEAFRHMVVFTPAHRQAFCVEPYTCTTDAANRNDGDWAVLPPGESVSLTVELWI